MKHGNYPACKELKTDYSADPDAIPSHPDLLFCYFPFSMMLLINDYTFSISLLQVTVILNQLLRCLPVNHTQRANVSKATYYIFMNRKGGDLLIISSFLACSDLCRLLITFANCLDPDQDRQNVDPYLDPDHLTLR